MIYKYFFQNQILSQFKIHVILLLNCLKAQTFNRDFCLSLYIRISVSNIENIILFFQYIFMKTYKKSYFPTKLLFIVFFIGILISKSSIAYGQNFLQIESILVDACAGTQEGENEMVGFHVENTAINVADIRVDGASNTLPYQTGKWPNVTNNSFLGWIVPGTANYDTAVAKIALINAHILNCGKLIIPTGGTNGQGLIPAGKKGLIITSTDFSPFADDFSLLSDTLYVVFQKSGNTAGHFTNYGTSAMRYLRLHQISTGTNEDVSYNKSLLITVAGTPGAEDGGGVRFTDAGIATYYNDGCQAPYIPLSAAWTTTSICQSAAALNLNTLLAATATTGGTWSGTGVTGNTFNPAGLSGNVSITYKVGTTSCSDSLTQNINVIASAVPSWTPPASICQSAGALNLNTLLDATATSGGIWSGTGVTGNTFNPTGLSGNISIKYKVGTAPCLDSAIHVIQVITSANAAWTPPTSICQSATAVNLNTYLDAAATTGGTWSGSGVTGNTLNPAGLSGNISIQYKAGNSPCADSITHVISVIASANASWTPPTSICQSATAVNLNTYLDAAATTGGTWSGSGVTGNTFNPAGLSGNINVKYKVGTAPCLDSAIHVIQVITSANAAWTPPASICQSAAAINLNTYLDAAATTGGTWSGTGVTGNTFNPAGLSGNISVKYKVGTAPCLDSAIHVIQVIASSNASWTPPTPICQSATAVNLNTYLDAAATTGGTWSGTGVTGNTFNPAGLSGNISVKYKVGTAPCLDSAIHVIQVITSANAAWTPPASICQSATAVNLNTYLDATATTGGTWSGTGVTGNTFNPAGLSGNISIQYKAGNSPCSDSVTHIIQVLLSANAAWTAPSSICADATPIDLSLLVTGDNGGTWSGTGVSGSIFNPAGLSGNIAISYLVNPIHGCPETVTHTISVTPVPIASWNAPTVICKIQPTFDLNTLITGTQGGTWSGNGITSNLLDLTTVGNDLEVTYTVTNNGCVSSSTAMLHFSSVDANFTISPTSGVAPLNTSTTNLSQNAISYYWNFGNGVTSTEESPSTQFLYEGTFYVWLTATSALGCKDSTYQIVTVDESPDFIPNVFTPNEDMINDEFYPIISKIAEDYHMMIFNRWGELIFETTRQKDRWDGTYHNAKVPVGVYFYVITYHANGKNYYYNGSVTTLK